MTEKTKNEKKKYIDGFTQFLASSPFLIGLWLQQDIESFNELGNGHSLALDGTLNIAVKFSESWIFYFTFAIYSKAVKIEPVPTLEVLTDCHDERLVTCLLPSLLCDEQKWYGHKVKPVPIICKVDLSWSLIGAILSEFNAASLEKYLERSFQIRSGKDFSNHLPTVTLLHSVEVF